MRALCAHLNFYDFVDNPLFICYSALIMVVRMRHTKGKRNRVRSHHALKKGNFAVCQHCKMPVLPHIVCNNCGYYKGRKVIDVLAKLDKKGRKKKEKELEKTSNN